MISFYGGPQGIGGKQGEIGENGKNFSLIKIISLDMGIDIESNKTYDSLPGNIKTWYESIQQDSYLQSEGNWLGVVDFNNRFFLFTQKQEFIWPEETQSSADTLSSWSNTWLGFYISENIKIYWDEEESSQITFVRLLEEQSIFDFTNSNALIFDFVNNKITTSYMDDSGSTIEKEMVIPQKYTEENPDGYVPISDITLYQVGDLIVRQFEDQGYLVNDNNSWIELDGTEKTFSKKNNAELYNLIDNATIKFPIEKEIENFPELNTDNFNNKFINYDITFHHWSYSENKEQIYCYYSTTKDSTYDWFFVYDITESGLKYNSGGVESCGSRNWDVRGGITGGYYRWGKDYDKDYFGITNLLTKQLKTCYLDAIDSRYAELKAFQDWSDWFVLSNSKNNYLYFYNFTKNECKSGPIIQDGEKTYFYKHYLIFFGLTPGKISYSSYLFPIGSDKKSIQTNIEENFKQIFTFSHNNNDYLIGITETNFLYLYKISIDNTNQYLTLTNIKEKEISAFSIDSLYTYKDYIIINKYFIKMNSFLDPKIEDIFNNEETLLIPTFSLPSFYSNDNRLEDFCHGNSYQTFFDLIENASFDKTIVLNNPFEDQNLYTYLKIK